MWHPLQMQARCVTMDLRAEKQTYGTAQHEKISSTYSTMTAVHDVIIIFENDCVRHNSNFREDFYV
jgi:hypothetical protein